MMINLVFVILCAAFAAIDLVVAHSTASVPFAFFCMFAFFLNSLAVILNLPSAVRFVVGPNSK